MKTFMKSFFLRSRVMFAAIGISSATLIAVSLFRGEMGIILIVDGVLVGTSLISFMTSRLLQSQDELIKSILATNQNLLAQINAVIEVNRCLQTSIAPDMPLSPPRSIN